MKRVATNVIDNCVDALNSFDEVVDEYCVMTDKIRDSIMDASLAGDYEVTQQMLKGLTFLIDSLEDTLDRYMKEYYTSKY